MSCTSTVRGQAPGELPRNNMVFIDINCIYKDQQILVAFMFRYMNSFYSRVNYCADFKITKREASDSSDFREKKNVN
jgi:hypothetical protein